MSTLRAREPAVFVGTVLVAGDGLRRRLMRRMTADVAAAVPCPSPAAGDGLRRSSTRRMTADIARPWRAHCRRLATGYAAGRRDA
ncbi:hypothetical protein O7635_01490 [Asanoa sp. WMMD1127]|uniref:hypothetical protein n=1 Tax=Asanoa sp. WMMD1127 TaxID=3016107 RepID=UPI00241733CB|nr:hypothetical protein [Asanoa sp. WMMD1127]MDG4820525.1 hypothetical protein [Asanoa sp. WMMD1127]